MRLLAKVRRPYDAPDEDQAIHDHTDDVTAFFVAAYHVKDHVQKESPQTLHWPSRRVRDESEALFHVDPTWEMAFTQELCTLLKHGENQNPKTHITRIRGMKAACGPRDQAGRRYVSTVYDTDFGLKFAHQVMHDVVVRWLDFIDRAYQPRLTAATRSQLRELGPPPTGLDAVDEHLTIALARGDHFPSPPLTVEIPVNAADVPVYWQSLPELGIPDMADAQGDAAAYEVHGFDEFQVREEYARAAGFEHAVRLPAVRIMTQSTLARYRLPLPYSDIVVIQEREGGPMPARIEFGRIAAYRRHHGYFMHILGPA